MPRYYNAGASAIVPEVFAAQATDEEHRKDLLAAARKHHPITGPARENLVLEDGKVKLKVPLMYCPKDEFGRVVQKHIDWEAGSLAFGLPGYGFWVIPPGKYVDLDVSVPESAVKGAAPHLLTEAEYAAVAAVAQKAEQPKKQGRVATE